MRRWRGTSPRGSRGLGRLQPGLRPWEWRRPGLMMAWWGMLSVERVVSIVSVVCELTWLALSLFGLVHWRSVVSMLLCCCWKREERKGGNRNGGSFIKAQERPGVMATSRASKGRVYVRDDHYGDATKLPCGRTRIRTWHLVVEPAFVVEASVNQCSWWELPLRILRRGKSLGPSIRNSSSSLARVLRLEAASWYPSRVNMDAGMMEGTHCQQGVFESVLLVLQARGGLTGQVYWLTAIYASSWWLWARSILWRPYRTQPSSCGGGAEEENDLERAVRKDKYRFAEASHF